MVRDGFDFSPAWHNCTGMHVLLGAHVISCPAGGLLLNPLFNKRDDEVIRDIVFAKYRS